MKITSPGSTPALITDQEGNSGRPAIAPQELTGAMDKAFSGRLAGLPRKPGKLTEMINGLPPDQQEQPVSPRLSVAVLTSRSMQRTDMTTERPAAEAGMLAQRDGYFQNNNHPMISANGWKPTDRQLEELAVRQVVTYLSNGLIKPKDTAIDVGSAKGYFAQHLAGKVASVEAIEPGKFGESEHPVFGETKPLTAEQYIKSYPDKRFSVVHAGNFSPRSDTGFVEVDTCKQVIGHLSQLTTDDGTTLLGVSSMDPQFVSGTSQYRLRPLLEQCFGKVEYLSPKKLGQEFSIGGQMGVFKCSLPKRDSVS